LRIAIGIISLVLMLVIGLQSIAISVGNSITGNEQTSTAAGYGILVAFLYLVGGAFSFKLPRVSMVVFILAALLGLPGSSDFKDLRIWGIVSLILAVLCYFTGRKKKAKKEQDQPSERLAPGEYRIKPDEKRYL